MSTMMAEGEGYVVAGLTRGGFARLKRLAQGWRQVDVAAIAKVSTELVIDFEKDRDVPDHVTKRILEALDLD